MFFVVDTFRVGKMKKNTTYEIKLGVSTEYTGYISCSKSDNEFKRIIMQTNGCTQTMQTVTLYSQNAQTTIISVTANNIII